MPDNKLPWMKWWPADWLSDEKLRLCSLAARGLWMDLLCVMHRCDHRGCLQQASGKPFTDEQVARIAGCAVDEASLLLKELVETGAASVSEQGVIMNRRMVRDESLGQVRRRAGRKGGKKTGNLLKQNSSKTQAKSQAKCSLLPLASSLSEEGCVRGETNGTGTSKPKARDELFDAVCEVTGSDPKVSASHVAKVCKALRSADPQYTPDEVRRFRAEVNTWKNFTGPPSLGLLAERIGLVRAKKDERNGKASPPASADIQANLELLRQQEREAAERLRQQGGLQ